MNKYSVTFIKKEIVEVEALNIDEAEEKAEEILDNDMTAWLNPCDEIITKKIKSTYLVTIKNSELSLNIPAYNKEGACLIAEDLGFNVDKIVEVN